TSDYVVHAWVPDSLERVVTARASVDGTAITLPALHATLLGHVSGRVTRSGAADGAAIHVIVEGTSADAFTDATGAFVVRDVPVGAHSVRFEAPGADPLVVADVAVAWRAVTNLPDQRLVSRAGSDVVAS